MLTSDTIVYLTWYDVTSYSKVLPVSISALVLLLGSICFRFVQFCTLNVHISICFCMGFRHAHLCTNDHPYYSCMGFRHAHLCTNDYPYSYGYSSCTFLYEWLSIFISVFVIHISVRMTIQIIFEWVFVMHIHVLMTTIYFWIGFCHAHFCTNGHHFFLYGFSSDTR